MKLKLLGLAFCALSATHAFATDQDKCTLMGLRGEMVMDSRQSGVPLSRMLEVAGTDEVLKVVIRNAFEVPRYHSDEMQQRAVADYRELWERVCFTPIKRKSK
jgi:hypothetical protein